jgi:hypothetical protein
VLYKKILRSRTRNGNQKNVLQVGVFETKDSTQQQLVGDWYSKHEIKQFVLTIAEFRPSWNKNARTDPCASLWLLHVAVCISDYIPSNCRTLMNNELGKIQRKDRCLMKVLSPIYCERLRRGGLGSSQGLITWNLWYIKWHWGRFSPSTLVSPWSDGRLKETE